MNKKLQIGILIAVILGGVAIGLQSRQSASGKEENSSNGDIANIEVIQDNRSACDIEKDNELESRRKKVRSQLETMSLEEKIGQMIITGLGNPDGGKADVLDEESAGLVREQKIGGVIFFGYNISTEEKAKAMIQDIKKISLENSDIPMFFALDEEGGRVSRLPETMEKTPSAQSIGATGDPEKAYEAGRQIASNMRKLGFNLDFAPVCDLNTNPGNPVIGDRAFSSDAQTAAEMASRFYRGLKEGGVMGVAKHFPGHGDTATDSHLELPSVDTEVETLKNRELIPFKAAIQAEVDMVMTSHILVKAIDQEYPATLSEKVKKELLFDYLGYEGLVISDDLNMKAITDHYTMTEAAKLAIDSGCDLLLISHDTQKTKEIAEYLVKSVKNNQISMDKIDASVEKILMLKGSLT